MATLTADLEIISATTHQQVKIERCVIYIEPFNSCGWVSCCSCEKVVHTTCVSQQYKCTGGKQPKNGIAYLYGMLNNMYFRLIALTAILSSTSQTALAFTEVLRAQIFYLNAGIEDLHCMRPAEDSPVCATYFVMLC